MFEQWVSYTREEIHAQVGGSMQSFLPHVAGRVVAVCLRRDYNPDAPAVILVGAGEGIEQAAEMLVTQGGPVPTFLKQDAGDWEYVGEFAAERSSQDAAELAAQSRRSGRNDITRVIYMAPLPAQLQGMPKKGSAALPRTNASRLVDLVRQESGVDLVNIMLLRHFNIIDRLVELGGTVEEFTSLQPTGTRWDFWADGKPQINVVVVIVHDRVFGVYRVLGIEAEATIGTLASEAHQRFDLELERWKPDRPARRFRILPIPCSATNATITGWEGREINAVVRSNAGIFQEIEVNLPERTARLTDQEGDRERSNIEVSFNPQESDRRSIVERQIRERRGRQQFRDALRKRYRNRCLVTGCEVLAVLEAAHISPYRGEDDNHPQNGLLLRADIHTLFDLDLLGIEPEHLRVELHPDVVKEYGRLGDVTLGCVGDKRPSREALRLRYERFRRGFAQPT